MRMCIYGGINKFELEIDNQEVLMQNVHRILWFWIDDPSTVYIL